MTMSPLRTPVAHPARRPKTLHAQRPAGVVRLAPRTHPNLRVSHLRALESEAVHVLREVAAEFERPVLLFSGGKDSIVLLRLAE